MERAETEAAGQTVTQMLRAAMVTVSQTGGAAASWGRGQFQNKANIVTYMNIQRIREDMTLRFTKLEVGRLI